MGVPRGENIYKRQPEGFVTSGFIKYCELCLSDVSCSALASVLQLGVAGFWVASSILYIFCSSLKQNATSPLSASFTLASESGLGLCFTIIFCQTYSSVIESRSESRRLRRLKGLSSRLNMRDWLKSIILSCDLVICSIGFVMSAGNSLPFARPMKIEKVKLQYIIE